MTRKIFHSILLTAFTVLIAGLIVTTLVMFSYFGNIQKSQLNDELNLAANATEELGIPYLKRLTLTKNRLTLIDANGNVVFDSHVDIHGMENHKDREEVRLAQTTGSGSSIRHSSTLTEQTIYIATRLFDGSVLRISSARASSWTLMLGMLQPLCAVFVLALSLSALLAMRMAKHLVEPLNSLNIEAPLENDVYEEISPLLRRIYSQQREIQKKMQELAHKKKEFEQITSNMKEALVILDQSMHILSINPVAKEIFDADFDCIGSDFLTIDRNPDLSNALEAAKANAHHRFRAEKNGCEYLFDISRIDSNEENAAGFQGIVLLAFDISEQVRAEQHRKEFTANISHELKTPLQSIIGSAELLENNIVKQEDIPRFIGMIKKEASGLVLLIDDIIQLSQLDEGVRMHFEELSLLDLARDVCNSLGNAASLSKISLNVAGDAGTMIGVRDLLIRIIHNLCDNAVKYNHEGGSVRVLIRDRAKFVELSVHDTGIGIPCEYHDKIFERFYRVDKSHSKQTGGTGLGLSIVKHAALIHGGKITVQSEVQKGTVISIVFPRSQAKA